MKSGVDFVSSSTVSRARCAAAMCCLAEKCKAKGSANYGPPCKMVKNATHAVYILVIDNIKIAK